MKSWSTCFFAVFLSFNIVSLSDIANAQMSEMQFTQLYISKLKKTFPTAKIRRTKPLTVTIKNGGKEKSEVFLDNAYQDYQSEPEQLTAILNRYINHLLKPVLNAKNNYNPKQILPVIRSKYYVQQAMKLNKTIKLIYTAISPELYVLYAFDRPTTIRLLIQGDLKKLKLKKSQLHRQALKNLRRTLRSKIRLGKVKSLYIYEADGSYESSLILLNNLWSKKNLPVKGKPVIFLPKRNLLVIAGSKDPEGLKTAYGFTQKTYNSGGHSLTLKAHIRKNGKWVLFREQ